jgi:hypothetical protein
MEAWLQGLSTLNKVFLLSAFFFSILSIWQLLGSLLGVGGHFHGHEGHVHVEHHGHTTHPHEHSASDRVPFTFVSLRSLIAFGTLFSWAGTLYLAGGTNTVLAISLSALWGLGSMFVVSLLLYWLVRLEETGNLKLASALHEEAMVYIDLPVQGSGQIRVKVDGMIQYVKARSITGEPMKRGTKVKVVGIYNDNTLEVEALQTEKGE